MTAQPFATRRSFLYTAALTTAATALAPRTLFAHQVAAAPPDRLAQMRAAGASAKITTQPLRGNINALLGSGGNIAVLQGKDGKLLVDSGFSTSHPQIAEALAALSPDPLTPISSTPTGTPITPTAIYGCTRPAPPSSRT